MRNTGKKEIKNIAFISPKRTLWSKNEKINSMFRQNVHYIRPWYTPPLGLLTIAAMTPSEIVIEYIDEDFDIVNFNISYSIVALSAMTQQIYRAYEIAEKFREKGVPTVLGGIHASILPEEALQFVDTVIIGEGEQLWNTYLTDFKNGNTKKIYKNKEPDEVDIKTSPIPLYHVLTKHNVQKNDAFTNMIPVQATRGCPHNCSFCVVTKINGKKIRSKTVNQVINEIKFLQKLYNNKLILFTDDNLFVDKKYSEELLKELAALKIYWAAQSDISIGEYPGLLKLAYKSGCVALLIGFESLNSENLQTINISRWKSRQLEKYSNGITEIQKNGIQVYAAFIVGFDYDDATVFTDIRDFMIRHYCMGQFTVLTPLPGTRLYKKLFDQGRLFSETFWDKCNFFDITFKPQNMSVEDIENGIIRLYNEIFNEKEFLNRFDYMKKIFKSLPARWE